MNTDIINYSDVNVSDIKYDMPQKKTDYYYSMINYNKKNNLLCHITNVKFVEFKNQEIPTMMIQIDNKFRKYLETIDKHTRDIINNNKIKWFNKDIPDNIIKKMYNSLIPNEDHHIIQTRVAKLNETILCKVFDSDKIRMDINDIKKDEKFSCVINFKGLKITKQQLTLDLCINQIRLYRESIPKSISGEECIIDDKDDKYPDEYIDNIEIEEGYTLDKIKLLYHQKKEDTQRINELNSRIKNIDEEIKLLKYKININ